MLYRLIIVTVCVVLFINSCNSLLSGVTGTHKLRTFTMDYVEQNGIGDADYVEITNAWRTDEFRYAPPRKGERSGLIQYAVMSQERYERLVDTSLETRIALIAWTENFDPACVENNNCISAGETTIKGVVRKMSRAKNKVKELPEIYQVAPLAIFIETDRAPIVWYWHLAFMFGAVLIGIGTEYIYNLRQRRQRLKNEKANTMKD